MLKQYRCEEAGWFKQNIYIYHDGELIETKTIPFTESENTISQLESDGYKLGYTQDEINEEKKRFNHMKNNMISKNITTKPKWRYDYLISFKFNVEGHLTPSSGSIRMSCKTKLKTFEDIIDMTNTIQDILSEHQKGVSNVNIYNFILLGRNKH